MGARTWLGIMAGLGGLAALGVKRTVDGIDAADYPVPDDEVRSDVVGERVVVDRPDGTRILTAVTGDGPDVVMLHGYASSMVEFNVMQRRLLALGHRVICVDWRGHGGTTTGSDGITPEVASADIGPVLEAHDVTDAVLVGHSTGGYVALGALLDHPEVGERVRGLVLMASLAGDAAVDNPQNAAQIPLITSGVMERAVAYRPLGLLMAASVHGPGASAAVCEMFVEDFVRADHAALVPLLKRLATTSYYDRLGEIDVPTVVVCGEDDATTPRWHSERLGSDIPGARNVWVPGAGHMLNWQAPDVCVEAVTSLLASAGA